MNLLQTNIPGFKKNKETNVILNDPERIKKSKAVRQRFKEQKLLINKIKEFEDRIKKLEKKILE